MVKNKELTIKFRKINGYYSQETMPFHSFNNLASFLNDDVLNDPGWWLQFLDNPKEDMMMGDMQELDKEDNQVFIGYQYHKGPGYRDPYAFETTIPELKRIIKKWVKLYNEQPDFIILKYENGKVTLESE